MSADMIDARQAVNTARDCVKSLYPPEELRHLRLEEIEPSDDGRQWSVTLGWTDLAVTYPATVGNFLRESPQRIPRVYKRVLVNATTGEVEAIRIRDVD